MEHPILQVAVYDGVADICPGQISLDYDRAEIIADGVGHAIGVCLGAHRLTIVGSQST